MSYLKFFRSEDKVQKKNIFKPDYFQTAKKLANAQGEAILSPQCICKKNFRKSLTGFGAYKTVPILASASNLLIFP